MTARLLFEDLYREPLADPIATPPVAHPMAKAEQATGEQRRDAGIARAVWSKESAVAYAREAAVDIARGVLPHADGTFDDSGFCTADDIAAFLEADGKPPLGMAAGAVFRTGNWENTGRTEKSKRAHMQATALPVWRFKYTN